MPASGAPAPKPPPGHTTQRGTPEGSPLCAEHPVETEDCGGQVLAQAACSAHTHLLVSRNTPLGVPRRTGEAEGPRKPGLKGAGEVPTSPSPSPAVATEPRLGTMTPSRHCHQRRGTPLPLPCATWPEGPAGSCQPATHQHVCAYQANSVTCNFENASALQLLKHFGRKITALGCRGRQGLRGMWGTFRGPGNPSAPSR